MEILKWEDVSFAYDGQFGIKRLSHGLEEGDFTLFFGPNGAGKTTLFRLAAGLLKPEGGEVFLSGKLLNEWQTLEVAKRVAYLEQEIQYSFPFTVEEIVLMGRFPHTASQFWDRKEDFETAVWAMETTGVLRFAKRSIFQLSGGERRKVEIARALCQKPKLMLLDEPGTFLDLRQQVELFEMLARLNREENISIGLISHQVMLARHYVKSSVFLNEGQIQECGAPGQLLTDARVSKFFGIASTKIFK
jgi:iron complex transport system ATP-binding protein